MFLIHCTSVHKLLYFTFFSASFCMTSLSAHNATSISMNVFSFFVFNYYIWPICCNFPVCVYPLIPYRCNIFMFTQWFGFLCVHTIYVILMPSTQTDLLFLIKYSFFAKMGYPEVKWSTVSSCCLYNWYLLPNSFWKKNLIFKKFVLIAWPWAATTVLSVPPLMSLNFSHQYHFSIATSFSPTLLANCPCSLFTCHLSYVFSATLSFVLFLSVILLRHL